MTSGLDLSLSPERLDEGAPEEIATFGQLVIGNADFVLTEGFDSYLDGYRKGPFVAGYYLAEWLAWHWWRLRWEPRRDDDDWRLAHEFNTIGNGYQWPNITVFSDGVRVIFLSRRSSPQAEPFRYAGAPPLIVPARQFESAVDTFVSQMAERVRPLGDTNLHRLWRDVVAERADTDIATRRRLEALLGREPDAGDDQQLESFVEDALRLGTAAVDEVAADAGTHDAPRNLHADDFDRLATELGYEGRSVDGVQLDIGAVELRPDNGEPWRVGAAVAQALRSREQLGDLAISDDRLAQMAGVGTRSLSTNGKAGAPFSFALASSSTRSRTVFRTTRKTGRRFDLARMIGDRLLTETADRLHPATDTVTWRQQAQRSFAVELLAPIQAVRERLGGDLSLERQHDVADQFIVSPMAINSLLKNYRLLQREDPFEDVSRLAA